jgi:hypothetical protein
MQSRAIVTLPLLVVVEGAACTTLPRMQTSQNCDALTPSTLVVRSVDRAGRDVPFAKVAVTSDNRAVRMATATSSAGTARFPIQPGSYMVSVGDNGGDWQSARTSVRVRPGCVVTLRAQLLEYGIAPEDSHLRDGVRRR